MENTLEWLLSGLQDTYQCYCHAFFFQVLNNAGFEILSHTDTLIEDKGGTENKSFNSRKSHCKDYLLQNDIIGIAQGSL